MCISVTAFGLNNLRTGAVTSELQRMKSSYKRQYVRANFNSRSTPPTNKCKYIYQYKCIFYNLSSNTYANIEELVSYLKYRGLRGETSTTIEKMIAITNSLLEVVFDDDVESSVSRLVVMYAERYKEMLMTLLADNEILRCRLDHGSRSVPSHRLLLSCTPAALPKPVVRLSQLYLKGHVVGPLDGSNYKCLALG